ncbi:type II toxin-antitoxin system RelB/DinJ family antitoxin [Pararhizobium sp.]|uniref:type II toxin-antitoxin system RelB/DinJ family antitoxin n=1 Tax=Pararhizobium sp. TaxID=1977563 RepID=UPI0027160E8A|nr:type II toxin-antitoxin system RelB/DinJ family antitoxin [Pararhizobium sp.]MDO9418990.1 type II toxin-antitoxin system RelB/DinJ family antitoxin [Pararhizobium sp.]
MTATKMLHIRVDDDLSEDAAAVYRSLGLSMSEAIRLFLHRSVASQGLPLELKVPNAKTRAALAEAGQMQKARKSLFATPSELFADLDSEKRPE